MYNKVHRVFTARHRTPSSQQTTWCSVVQRIVRIFDNICSARMINRRSTLTIFIYHLSPRLIPHSHLRHSLLLFQLRFNMLPALFATRPSSLSRVHPNLYLGVSASPSLYRIRVSLVHVRVVSRLVLRPHPLAM